MRSLTLTALAGVPEILRGADLPALIEAALQRSGVQPQAGDALVLAQKIVSKAEGRQVDLRTVTPSAEALRLAPITGKDARYVEVVLRESRTVLRAVPGVMSAAVGSRHARIGGAGDFLRAARGIAGSRATRSDAGHEQYEQSRHDMKTLMHKQSPFRVKKPRRQPRSHRASECCVNETTGELRYALARFYRCVVAITADRSL